MRELNFMLILDMNLILRRHVSDGQPYDNIKNAKDTSKDFPRNWIWVCGHDIFINSPSKAQHSHIQLQAGFH